MAEMLSNGGIRLFAYFVALNYRKKSIRGGEREYLKATPKPAIEKRIYLTLVIILVSNNGVTTYNDKDAIGWHEESQEDPNALRQGKRN